MPRIRTCKFFLRNNCKFSQNECKYSHKIEHKNIICKFYKEGICRYTKCGFLHPPFCKAFLENKNERPNGCFREGCKFFHPNLCNDVEMKGDCLRRNCRFYHRANGYYQGSKWTDDKVNESRARHGPEGKYDNYSRWYDPASTQNVRLGARTKTNNQHTKPVRRESEGNYDNTNSQWYNPASNQNMYLGARPKTNNQHSTPAYSPVSDREGYWNQNQNWQYRNSYSSKLKSGIHDNRDNDFLWQEMVQAFRDVQRLLQDRHMAVRV